MKILILQKNINSIASSCSSLDDMHELCEQRGKALGHSVQKLTIELEKEYPNIHIGKYGPVLEKLQEYFNRRYVVCGGSSIRLDMIDDVDAFYFLLRTNVSPEVGLGVIDEIYIRKKHGWGYPLAAFQYAYLRNKSFGPRRHRKIKIMGPDFKTYEEEGT